MGLKVSAYTECLSWHKCALLSLSQAKSELMSRGVILFYPLCKWFAATVSLVLDLATVHLHSGLIFS